MAKRLSGVKPTEPLADLSLLFVAITWGSTYVIVKQVLENTALFSFIFLRYALACLFLLFFNLSRLQKIDLRLVKDGCVLGVILFLGYSFQTLGLRLTPAPIMAFTTGLYVVIVPFLQRRFLNIRLGWEAVLGVLLALFGLYYITMTGKYTLYKGIIFGVICAAFYATHITLVHKYSTRNDFNLLTLFQLLIVTLLSLVSASVYEPYILPPDFDGRLILALFITGILGTAVAFLIMISMQKHTTPTKAAIIYMMESVSSILFNYLLLGELLTARQYVGIGFIFLAILVTQLGNIFKLRRLRNFKKRRN